MRYDTLEMAKEHCNACACRKGFAVIENITRRYAYIGELEKQQFSCNKFRKPKKENDGTELVFDLGLVLDPVPPDEDERANAELASVVAEIARQGPKKKEPLKRKRENIVQTDCKAKILLKLIDGRWEVIIFVPEHNHPLIQKPSLIKYLRSHSGIPREEKDFVKNSHNTNLTAGMFLPHEVTFFVMFNKF
jgi:hypothetical protein